MLKFSTQISREKQRITLILKSESADYHSVMTFGGLIGLILFVGIPFGVTYFLTGGQVFTAAIIAAVFGIAYLLAGLRVIYQYERGVLFRLGKYSGIVNPGLVLIFPVVEDLRKVSLRVEVADAPPQEIITRDNIPLNINAVAYYKVSDPTKAILEVDNYRAATFQIAQTTIRSVVGQHEMDEVLTHRDKINEQLKSIIDKETDQWGISIVMVELKDVELPQNLKRAMAKQAEAERERRARVILATGELEASEKLQQAGQMVSQSSAAMQLRLLQTLQEISVEKNSTIVFPLPIELLNLIPDVANRLTKGQ